MRFKSIVLAVIILFFIIPLSQSQDKEKEEGYQFTIKKELPATPVKNQYKSNTCWSFSSLSFVESELLRMGKGEYDLSEMFIVYNDYFKKAVNYARWQGNASFSAGGEFHDVLDVIKDEGIVPQEAYTGLVIGEKNPVQFEMDGVLRGFMDKLIKNENGKLTPVWPEAITGILNAYLGDYPETFTYQGKEYTPRSFADQLGFDPDQYVEIGSYTHHPFYTRFIIEIPDNWAMRSIYNVPLDEMMEILDNSLANGYTVGWGADISEKGFSWSHGVAIVPDVDMTNMSDAERANWDKMTRKEREKAMYSFSRPVPEENITQEMRQRAFDDYQTTDDHGMHITGTAVDQNGTPYYYVKNSWGTTGNDYDGHFFASKPFVEYKTIMILVNKDAIPKAIRNKLGL